MEFSLHFCLIFMCTHLNLRPCDLGCRTGGICVHAGDNDNDFIAYCSPEAK